MKIKQCSGFGAQGSLERVTFKAQRVEQLYF